MKARVLIIEDVQEMGELIQLYLQKEGMDTVLCATAEEGLALHASSSFDLIVLDINLPGMDGFEFLQRVRPASGVPVMIVSARDADEDLILGLGIGADEFITKPFSPKVLTARVRALLRRAAGLMPAVHACVRFGEFSLDLEGCLLKRGGQKVPLSAKEFEVLACLARNPGKVLSPQAIYSEVWKNAYGDLSAVAVYVQRLRRKIEEDPAAPRFIVTVPRLGYRFDPGEDRG